MDCVFILHSIVKRLIENNILLFCAFIDYEKAFDTVLRDALWFKLFEIGIKSKMLKLLQAIYEHVSASVKVNANISDIFEISLGLKQGEPLSPLLFIMFINDVSLNINFNALTEI